MRHQRAEGGRCHERHQIRDHHRRQTRQRRASRGGAVRAVSFGQDQPAREHSLRHGGHRPARIDSRGTSDRRRCCRGAQARHGHRDQCRLGRLSRRPVDLPRRPGFDRVPARCLRRPRGVRRRRPGLRAVARAGGGADAALEIHRGPPHPAHHLRQQDRFRRGPRARHAVGAAERLVAQARAAPGADPPPDQRRRRGDDGLCRPRERARLPLQERAARRT